MAKKRDPLVTRSPEQISLFSAPAPPDAFRKAVQVVHSKPKSPLSLLQRKLGNAWLKNAIENAPDGEGWWTLGIKALSTSVGFDSNNRQYLKESAEALMRIIFEWDVIAPTSKRVPWKASVLFPEVEIGSDIIRYQISAQMRERMTNPDIYALIDMNIVRKFRRASSLAIWEFCIRFEKVGRTAPVPWQKFRDMVLGESGDNKTYGEYKFFKSKVLNPAIAEINAASNHQISLLEIKLGRRVDSVQFAVARDVPVELAPDNEDSIELLSELVKLGVPQSEAKRLVREQQHDALKDALQYTKLRTLDRKQTKIENPAAYFRHALTKRYAPTSDTSPLTAPAVAIAKPVDIKDAYAAYRAHEAERYFKELDPSDEDVMIQRYNSWQGVPALKLKKKAAKAAQTAFYRWLADETWGQPSTETLLAFAQQMLSDNANIAS